MLLIRARPAKTIVIKPPAKVETVFGLIFGPIVRDYVATALALVLLFVGSYIAFHGDGRAALVFVGKYLRIFVSFVLLLFAIGKLISSIASRSVKSLKIED